jgi:hypothetical protein
MLSVAKPAAAGCFLLKKNQILHFAQDDMLSGFFSNLIEGREPGRAGGLPIYDSPPRFA